MSAWHEYGVIIRQPTSSVFVLAHLTALRLRAYYRMRQSVNSFRVLGGLLLILVMGRLCHAGLCNPRSARTMWSRLSARLAALSSRAPSMLRSLCV